MGLVAGSRIRSSGLVLLKLDVRRPKHLAPLVAKLDDELSKLGGELVISRTVATSSYVGLRINSLKVVRPHAASQCAPEAAGVAATA
jgi:hypothetical protein